MTEDTEQTNRNLPQPNQEWRILAHKDGQKIEIENQGELDEVVLEHWFHLEELGENEWWLRVGDARILVRVGEDGKEEVEIERGFYGQVTGKTTIK
jgi:hypothetical protein